MRETWNFCHECRWPCMKMVRTLATPFIYYTWDSKPKVPQNKSQVCRAPININNIHSHGEGLEHNLVIFHETARTKQVPRATIQSPSLLVFQNWIAQIVVQPDATFELAQPSARDWTRWLLVNLFHLCYLNEALQQSACWCWEVRSHTYLTQHQDVVDQQHLTTAKRAGLGP